MNDNCEWNPWTNNYAEEDDQKHGEAKFSVGAHKNIHICGRCALLPKFKGRTMTLLVNGDVRGDILSKSTISGVTVIVLKGEFTLNGEIVIDQRDKIEFQAGELDELNIYSRSGLIRAAVMSFLLYGKPEPDTYNRLVSFLGSYK